MRAYGRGEDGASAAEYAILLFVLCGCVFFGLHSLGRHTSHEIQNVARAINPRPRS